MQDVMIDLETMGTGPQAAIIAIGAVEFDIQSREIGEKFYVVVDLESSVAHGGVMDASTVLWWLKQSDAARAAFDRSGTSLTAAIIQFSSWMTARAPREIVRVWGNGAAFDNVILASAYRQANITQPWLFWNDRCYRTVKALSPAVTMQRNGTHHNALDDAESQARHLIAILTNRSTPNQCNREGPMDIVDSIERYLSGGDVSKGARTRMTRARDEIVRLRELCREAPHELTAEIAALRKDLDDALLALRHLRFIDHDSEHRWQAAVEEADAVLARFEVGVLVLSQERSYVR